MTAATGLVPIVFERGDEIGIRQLQRRREPCHQPSAERDEKSEHQRSIVERSARPASVGKEQLTQRVASPIAADRRNAAANESERHALDDQQTNYSTTCGAECEAN